MSETQMVLTAVGPDRPGIVQAISSAIYESGANIEDSRMAVLAGDFALIVLFSGSPDSVEKVTASGRDLEKKLDFNIHFRPATPGRKEQEQTVFSLSVIGPDQPGIVNRISSILAENGVNVESLESRYTAAAFSGAPLFEVRAEVALRDAAGADVLEKALGPACEDMNLSLDLKKA